MGDEPEIASLIVNGEMLAGLLDYVAVCGEIERQLAGRRPGKRAEIVGVRCRAGSVGLFAIDFRLQDMEADR